MRILDVYLQMLPRLRAEESMAAVIAEQLAEGRFDKQDADEIWREWRRVADPDREDEPEEMDPFWI